jgi:hypothetical protein
MGRPCSICQHPEVQRISKDLLSGVSYRQLQRTYRIDEGC